jgi:hypothetical protein
MHYTTLKLATDLEDILGNTKYHHQDSDIPNTGFILVFFYDDSRTNERDPAILYNLWNSLPMNYTTLKLATYLEEALGNTKYMTRTVSFQKQDLCWSSWIMAQGQMKGIHKAQFQSFTGSYQGFGEPPAKSIKWLLLVQNKKRLKLNIY